MDLNLVRVFVAVYELGTVTAAAERLFVTQSAVSQSLARLRGELGDNLFERDGRVMRATAAAERLYRPFEESLRTIEGAAAELRDFDPATAKHRFRLVVSELGEVSLLPTILSSIAAKASGVSLEIVPLDVSALPEWLSRGRIDLAIAAAMLPGDIEGTVLKTVRYVLLMSTGHVLANRTRIDRDTFLSASHLMARNDPAAAGVDAALERAGIHLKPDLVVGHVSAIPGLIHTGPWIAIVPESLARNWVKTWPFVYKAMPTEFEPIRVPLYLYTRSTGHESAALQWFHDTVLAAARAAPPRSWSPPDRIEEEGMPVVAPATMETPEASAGANV